MMDDEPEPQKCKTILIGDSGVGKTAISARFVNQNYDMSSKPTIGVDYTSKVMEFEETNEAVQIDIWDTAGNERYNTLNKLFYNNAKIAILVYDITDKKTYEKIVNFWYPQIVDYGGNDIIIGIVGNKNDRFDEEEVDENEVVNFAKSKGICFHKTSAKDNTGIVELFVDLCKEFLIKYKFIDKDDLINPQKKHKNDINKKNVFKLTKQKTKKKKKTCCLKK